MALLRVNAAIACEYIAEGHTNKHTLVNVYAGDILVPEFPAAFPMAFYLEIAPSFDETTPITLEIKRDRTILAKAESEVPPLPEGMNAFVIALPPLAIRATEPCKVTVVARAPGQRKVLLLAKTIRQGVAAG